MSQQGAARAVAINPPGESLGSRHAILAGRARSYHVEDFPGPASIKWVVSGSAEWRTEAGRFVVDPRHWLVLNDGRPYSITVDSPEPVETFCVFFRRGALEQARRHLVRPASRLIEEDPREVLTEPGFRETLRPAGDRVIALLRRIHGEVRGGSPDDLRVEEMVHRLAGRLAASESSFRRAAQRVPSSRPSTREELLRRVLRARDFMEASLDENLTLAAIAAEAFLSPFHFHRTFHAIFGETPRAYLVRRRLERAIDLLTRTDRPITRIVHDVGFSSPGSFSWLFRERYGVSPREYRVTLRQKSKPREVPRSPSA